MRARREASWLVLRSYAHMSLGRGVKWLGMYEFGHIIHRRNRRHP